MKMSGLSRLTPHFLSALRIVAAFLCLAHGTVKVFGYPPGAPHPPFGLLARCGAAGVSAPVGGALMLVGLMSRPVAFILSGEMAVAYFKQHAPASPWPIVNGGELAVLF